MTLPKEDNSILDAALMYAAMGLSPIVVYGIRSDGRCTCSKPDCGAPGKHPVGREWQKRATADPDKVRDMFAGHRGNIGIALGRGYVALDFDGEAGAATRDDLEPDATMEAITGSGGRHLIYRLEQWQQGGQIPNGVRVLPGMDIRADGGHIVVAPSLHASGGVYQWASSMEPAPLPSDLFNIVKRKAAPVNPTRPPLQIPQDVAHTVRRLRGTLAKHAPSISGQGGHLALFRACCTIVGNGLPESVELDLALEFNRNADPPWPIEDVERKLREARTKGKFTGLRERRSDKPPAALPSPPPPGLVPADDDAWKVALIYEQTRNGTRLKKCTENAVVILQSDPRWELRLRLDTFAQQIDLFSPPWAEHQGGAQEHHYWTDGDTTRLQGWMVREYDLQLHRTDLDAAVQVAAERYAYHSAREWFESLTWDGTPRIAHWMSTYLGAPATDYVAAVGRWWLISAVARSFAPPTGCKADHVLILEGPQGARKSTALRTLVGDAWFSDTPIEIGSKDAYQALSGRLVVELAELDSLKRTADSERAKAFFSSQVDRYRPPYARREVSVVRSCVFAGTTNQREYLSDETGNRRYWSVPCERIDVDTLARDREQLWAEAVAAYRDGAAWWPEGADHEMCAAEQALRVHRDDWHEVIAEWIRSNQVRETTGAIILERALSLPKAQWDRRASMRVADILKKLGGKVTLSSGARTRLWVLS